MGFSEITELEPDICPDSSDPESASASSSFLPRRRRREECRRSLKAAASVRLLQPAWQPLPLPLPPEEEEEATRSRRATGQWSNNARAKKLSDINTIRKKKNSSTPKRGAEDKKNDGG